MHRFLVSPDALQGSRIVLPEAAARQIRGVLRMRPGDRVLVLDGSGWEIEVVLTQVGQEAVVGEILDRRLVGGEPCVRITLYQSLLKRDNFEWVLQKCTEMGVAAFVPLVSQRAIVRRVGSSKLERWRRIIAEAVEQSRRGKLPVLRDAVRFEDAVSERSGDLSLIPWEKEEGVGLHAALDAAGLGERLEASLSLFVGPEGGFTEQEIALAEEHGVVPVTLGPRILRAETAAVVAASLILYEFGELG